MNQDRNREWADSTNADDWLGATVVALVLTAAVLISAVAIAAFDNSVRLPKHYSSTTSELPRTALGGGSAETDGRARR